jgi:hypothetical protein
MCGGVFACEYERRAGDPALPAARFQERGSILDKGSCRRINEIQDVQALR